MTNEKSADRCGERRRYYRVDDEVILEYCEVSPDVEEASSRSERVTPADGFTLGARFAALSRQLTPLRREIESLSVPTARYLAAIDMKLDMLAQVLLSQESFASDRPARKVNISAGGIAFTTDRALNKGSVLELRMILLPEMIGVAAVGRVVASRAEEQHPAQPRFRNSLEFVGLREAYRDLIVRHVRHREQEIRRKDRLNRNGSDYT